MRAKVLDGIRPPKAYLVLACEPGEDHPRLSALLGYAHEGGDGFFYIATTDAWVVRVNNEDEIVVRIQAVHDGEIQTIEETRCASSTSILEPETIMVTSNASWSSLEESLRIEAEW